MDYVLFEALYEAAQKRALIETLERRRDGMIAALWSNPNFDDDKGTRKGAIEEIEQNCEEVIHFILTGQNPEEEFELEDEYGFFAAGRRGQVKLMEKYGRNADGSTTVQEVIDYGEFVDQ
jgi:hypothetical protein